MEYQRCTSLDPMAPHDEVDAPSIPGRPPMPSSPSPAPGRASLVQARGGALDSNLTRQFAAAGVDGAGGALPHFARIQAAFGRHDISDIRAHLDDGAVQATRAIGAEAYATGRDVAFGRAPDLHTAAHEAAHVVQQRAGVSLLGGVGAAGDPYERHADAVADAVAAGQSAEALLDEMAPSGGGAAVQRTPIDGGLDTRNPQQREAIRQYLLQSSVFGKLSQSQLQNLHNQIVSDRHDGWEDYAGYIGELVRGQQSNAVEDLRRGDGKNYTAATLYFDGMMLHIATPKQSGNANPSSEWATYPGNTNPDITVSRRDSEVELLDELSQVFENRIADLKKASQIRLEFVSNNGACDGCKQRLLSFQDKILRTLRQFKHPYPTTIDVNYAYLETPRETKRRGTPTTYGDKEDFREGLPDGRLVWMAFGGQHYDPDKEGYSVEMQELSPLEKAQQQYEETRLQMMRDEAERQRQMQELEFSKRIREQVLARIFATPDANFRFVLPEVMQRVKAASESCHRADGHGIVVWGLMVLGGMVREHHREMHLDREKVFYDWSPQLVAQLPELMIKLGISIVEDQPPQNQLGGMQAPQPFSS
jgi:hypothetical protein